MRFLNAIYGLSHLALSAALLLGLAACQKSNDDTNDSGGDRDPTGLGLTVPSSRWEASKFCGAKTPDKPEDPTPEYRFDTTFINEKLAGDGLKGWMHGAVPTYQQYIFTYRKEDPSDFMAFFKAQQFSLAPANADIAKTLATLNRHDQVILKGRVMDNSSPLMHIRVSDIQIVKKYALATENAYTVDASKLTDTPEFEMFGLVHAIAHSDELGYGVILENKGVVLPVAIAPEHAEAASKLYRGDIVNMQLAVIPRKQGPAHFVSNAKKAEGITVVDPMLNCHGVERTVVGTLAKFDKSPAISTDVYAVRYVDSNGIARNFTFFPASEDQETFTNVFMGISAKAKAAWEQAASQALVIRNFRENPKIRVVARGRLNVVSLEQANAQVYINSPDDVTFEIAP